MRPSRLRNSAEKFKNLGVEIDLKSPAQFSAMISAEIVKWANVIKSANIKSPD